MDRRRVESVDANELSALWSIFSGVLRFRVVVFFLHRRLSKNGHVIVHQRKPHAVVVMMVFLYVFIIFCWCGARKFATRTTEMNLVS